MSKDYIIKDTLDDNYKRLNHLIVMDKRDKFENEELEYCFRIHFNEEIPKNYIDIEKRKEMHDKFKNE